MAETSTTNENPSCWQQFKQRSPLIINFIYLIPDLTLTVIAGLYAETSLALLWVVIFVTFCKFVNNSATFVKYFSSEKDGIWQENSHNRAWGRLLLYVITAMVVITSLSLYFSKTGTVLSLAKQLGFHATMPKAVALFAIILGLWCVLDSLTRANKTIGYFGWLLRRCFVAKPKQVQYLTIKDPDCNSVNAILYAGNTSKDVFLCKESKSHNSETKAPTSKATRFELAMIEKGVTLKELPNTEFQNDSVTKTHRIELRQMDSKLEKKYQALQEKYQALQDKIGTQDGSVTTVVYLSKKQQAALQIKTQQTLDVFFEYKKTENGNDVHYPIYTAVKKTKPPFMTRIGKKLQSIFDDWRWQIGIAIGTCCFDVIITCYASIAKWPFLIGLIIPCALFGLVETLVYNYKFYRKDKTSETHNPQTASRRTWAVTLGIGAMTMTSALTKFITKFLPAYAIASAVGAPHLFCIIFAAFLGIACVLRNVINGLAALETLHGDLSAKIDGVLSKELTQTPTPPQKGRQHTNAKTMGQPKQPTQTRRQPKQPTKPVASWR